jgi:hypothetical protein
MKCSAHEKGIPCAAKRRTYFQFARRIVSRRCALRWRRLPSPMASFDNRRWRIGKCRFGETVGSHQVVDTARYARARVRLTGARASGRRAERFRSSMPTPSAPQSGSSAKRRPLSTLDAREPGPTRPEAGGRARDFERQSLWRQPFRSQKGERLRKERAVLAPQPIARREGEVVPIDRESLVDPSRCLEKQNLADDCEIKL